MTSLTSYEDFQFETYRLDVIWLRVRFRGVGMIRVDVGPISETVYIDIILSTIIER